MAKILTPLLLQYHDGKTWTLADDFIVIAHTVGIIRVPKGFETDFNSIPRGLWNILPPDEYGEAAIVHDFLYKYAKVGSRPVTRAEADATHREFVQFAHAPAWKVHSIYWALRIGGWKAWNAHRANDPK